MNEQNIRVQKASLRSYLRQVRRREAAARAASSALFARRIQELLPPGARKVAGFLPLAGEPPLVEALTALHMRGMEVLVPIVEEERRLSWTVWEPGQVHPRSTLGIEEPTGPRLGAEAFLEADLHLIPALAYDLMGRRLGQGGGFYDTLLEQAGATLHSPSFLGLVFSSELLDQVPAEEHDAQLSFILTEAGLYRVPGREQG